MKKVAIVGRPNVGKSALFNRLAGRNIAIVDAESGVTRDRLYSPVEWNHSCFQLIDTGGLVTSPDELETHITRQVELALSEADLLLFAVDGQEGRTPLDDEIAEKLRKINKPVWLVVTKIDNRKLENAWTEFSVYGWENSFSVSALHKLGTAPLLDALAEEASQDTDSIEIEEKPAYIAIVGRPNSGKSSLINIICGTERAIVSDMAGTTRDAVDSEINWNYHSNGHVEEKNIVLIDTAGVRRKRTVKSKLDAFSINRAESAINRASVAVLLTDASVGITVTDKKIANIVSEAGTSCIIGINKWDLMEGKMDKKSYEKWLRNEMPFLSYAPLVFLSALTGHNVEKLINRAFDINLSAQQVIGTGIINRILHKAFEDHPPPIIKKRRLKLFYATQVGVSPPRFLLFVNDPKRVRASYKNYVVNKLRASLGFEGAPILINWRARKKQ